MAIASSGNISIKTAAGSGRSIDTDGRTDISSGSLVTLSTGNVVTSGNTIDGAAPHGMREFAGYTHTQTMSIAETNYARISSAGKCAHAHDHKSPNGSASNAIFDLRVKIINSGNNQSDFELIVYNTWNETFAGVNYKYAADGTQTTFSSYTDFKVYRGRFTGSGYSNLCPDSFKIDWSASVTESEINGDTDWDIVSGSYTDFSDNTYLSYPQTVGTHNFGRQFRAWAEAQGDGADEEGGSAFTIATVTFTPSFRKSGYYDKGSSYTHKFYLKANAVNIGEGGGGP